MQHDEPVWYNVFGERVDLDDIDNRYALNILTMALLRRGRRGVTDREVRVDPLIQKLREVVLYGRSPKLRDRIRAIKYNRRARREGIPLRAPVL